MRGFTLIELLVVVAIIAVLAVAVVLILNPAGLLAEARDAQRLSNLGTLSHAVAIAQADVPSIPIGIPMTVYASLPDPAATTTAGSDCTSLGLPALPNGYAWHCAASSTYRKADGTGWTPVNFLSVPMGQPLAQLPIDPKNVSSSRLWYAYATNGMQYEFTAPMESAKYHALIASDGGTLTSVYEMGPELGLEPLDYGIAVATSSGSYAYKRTITVSSNASGTLSNFPMLVSSVVSSWESTSTGGRIQNLCTAPNGVQEACDLAFTSDSGCSSPLSFETESYTSSTGALVDWVNVPTMQAGAVIYACYGNLSATTDQSNPAGTWNANYKGVWHFPNGTSLSVGDSTGLNTATDHGGTATTAGEIDGAASFNGSTQYVDMSTGTNLQMTGNFSVSAWVYRTGNGSGGLPGIVVAPENAATAAGYILGTTSNQPILYVDQTGNGTTYRSITSPGTLAANAWTFVEATFDGSNLNMYMNGVATGTPVSSVGPHFGIISIPAQIGLYGTSNYFQGVVDEARISNTNRPPSWILTEYNNQSSPSTFYSVGGEVAR
jgi:prepilin-type N-terminal cleavage/methylation domain-containing protein